MSLCLLIIGTPAVLGSQLSAPPVVLILGDSISAAYGMSLDEGWAALLARRLAEHHPDAKVINASISGETSAGAAARLPALLAQHQPGVVVIELGGNDGLRGYPVDRLQANLEQMTRTAQASGAKVLLLAMEIPPNYGRRYTQAFRQSFVAVAEATGAPLSPFMLDGVATDPALMQADGIHPSVAAQPLLLENVLPHLLPLLGDPHSAAEM